MESDREGWVSLPRVIVAEDMHLHLIVVDWRETKRAYINSKKNPKKPKKPFSPTITIAMFHSSLTSSLFRVCVHVNSIVSIMKQWTNPGMACAACSDLNLFLTLCLCYTDVLGRYS